MPALLFYVFNETDGIFCHPEPMTAPDCDDFIVRWRRRFQRQGYYLTAEGHRIPVAEVSLKIVPAEDGDGV